MVDVTGFSLWDLSGIGDDKGLIRNLFFGI